MITSMCYKNATLKQMDVIDITGLYSWDKDDIVNRLYIFNDTYTLNFLSIFQVLLKLLFALNCVNK